VSRLLAVPIVLWKLISILNNAHVLTEILVQKQSMKSLLIHKMACPYQDKSFSFHAQQVVRYLDLMSLGFSIQLTLKEQEKLIQLKYVKLRPTPPTGPRTNGTFSVTQKNTSKDLSTKEKSKRNWV